MPKYIHSIVIAKTLEDGNDRGRVVLKTMRFAADVRKSEHNEYDTSSASSTISPLDQSKTRK